MPIVLAVGGFLFSWAQRVAQSEIESERQREASLQAYIDRMTELILEKELQNSQPTDEIISIVRAQTRIVLWQLDGKRKGALLQFLYETGLLGHVDVMSSDTPRQPPIVWIGEAADLNGLILSRVSMHGIYLLLADLREARLMGVDLYGAILNGVDLQKARLLGVNLCKAELRKADLRGIRVRGSVMNAADLQFADLRGADLKEATLVDVNLAEAKYNSKTKWPRGFDPVSARAILEN